VKLEEKLIQLCRFVTQDINKRQTFDEPTYPLEVINSNKQRKICYNKSEHVEWAMMPSPWKFITKISSAKLNVTDIIPQTDFAWDILNLHFAIQRHSIQFFYKSYDEVPADVWDGLIVVGNELIRIENEKNNK